MAVGSVSNSLADVVMFQSVQLVARHCTLERTRTLCEFWGFDAAFAYAVGWNMHSKDDGPTCRVLCSRFCLRVGYIR